MDGPNHELNFQKGILQPQYCLKEIASYLRFYQGDDMYQNHLRTYLPKLAHAEYKTVFFAFIADYADTDDRKKLLDQLAAEENALRELENPGSTTVTPVADPTGPIQPPVAPPKAPKKKSK